jgi:acetyltransferase-like isoleucine patch superfamily enzyme
MRSGIEDRGMAHYRDGYKGGAQKYDFSLKSISRGLALLITPIFAYLIGLFPLVWLFLYVLKLVSLSNIIHLFFFSGFMIIWFFLFIIVETFIPGLFIRLLRLRIKEGVYEISILDWNFFKYSLYFVLYRPSLKLISILPLLPLRVRYLKLVGLKMGKSSVLAGSEIFHDPYMIEIGEQTLIGGWSQITGHVGEKKLTVKKVKIGNNCLIGGLSFIMPGAVIEDNVTLGLHSVVLKDMHLEQGKFYAGIPAKEVQKKVDSSPEAL